MIKLFKTLLLTIVFLLSLSLGGCSKQLQESNDVQLGDEKSIITLYPTNGRVEEYNVEEFNFMGEKYVGFILADGTKIIYSGDYKILE